MSIFKKPSFKSEKKKSDMPEGLWQKCPDCGEVIHQLTLVENLYVCPKCDYHFTIEAKERLQAFLDAGTFEEFDADMQPVDILNFRGPKRYRESLDRDQKKTGMPDAVITGTGKSEGRQIAVAAMDFRFLAASMGSVVGEKITRMIEYATRHRLPVVIFTAAGGARMHEGLFALMQMAKTSGALALHARARLPYIPVLTNPTTGGVSASFATLGDLILAEPKCMVGFAGPRVIRETTHQDLPPGFQTAEFLEDHGLVDLIVHRKKMRTTVAELLNYFTGTGN
ncbi:MAG: acetyl-CoA carboxylase, carboxyltransferase subunit beta [Chthoniobacteraceae bacterium]|jgi:acetyl-CoA carboxylase carboxyl transferase subunit beta